MASQIQAIRAYGPRLVRGQTVRKRELAKFIGGRTGYNTSEIGGLLEEFREAVIFFTLTGRGITLEGLGTFLPFIKQDGRISLSHRLDRSIWAAINAEGEFTGQIINWENIGKATSELIALWNANHPEDLVPTG